MVFISEYNNVKFKLTTFFSCHLIFQENSMKTIILDEV